MNDNPNMDDQTKHEIQKTANQLLPKEFYNLSDLEKLSLTSKLRPLLLEQGLVAYFYMTKIGVSILKNRSPETNILGEAILKLLKSKVLMTSDEAFIAIAEHDLMQMVSEAVKGNSYSLTDFEDRWTCFAPIQEVEIVKLEELLREKFEVAKEQEGFLTIRNFANRHLESFSELFGATALRFPVALQWIDFLKEVAEGRELLETVADTSTPSQEIENRQGIENDLSYPNVALILAYERINVTTKAEALEHGAKYRRMEAKTADLMLLQECTPAYSAQDRLAPLKEENNGRKVKALRKRLLLIEPHLSERAKSLFNFEMQQIEKYLTTLNSRKL